MAKDIYFGKKILVTGASSGIGLAFARILSGYPCTLILVSSNLESLKKNTAELKVSGKAKTLCFSVDLARLDAVKDFCRLLEEQGLAPDIIINNAGKQSYGYFHKLDWETEYQHMALNCLAPMYLMHRFIPRMIKNQFGKILNVGSVAGTMPGPFFATYASTKAFLNTFSLSVSGEMRRKNIQCACLLPGKTNCPRFWDTPRLTGKVKDTSGFASPRDVAQKGLRLLEENRDYGVQGLRNHLTQFVKRFVPLPALCFAIEKHNHNQILED